jgi:hypothetical protein
VGSVKEPGTRTKTGLVEAIVREMRVEISKGL